MFNILVIALRIATELSQLKLWPHIVIVVSIRFVAVLFLCVFI